MTLPLLLLAALAHAGVVKAIPPIKAPVSPTPVVAQLHLDMAVLKGVTALPPALVALAPAAPMMNAAPVPQLEALQRLEITKNVLAQYDPAEFAKMDDSAREQVLSRLWDGWSKKGLADSGLAADQLIVDGVADKELTSANKSIFLGVGVLGYPLQDARWLASTRIRDALDENTLRYPSGQRWHTEDGTPEFLGTTKEAQETVDAWGAATDYAKQVVARVKAGQRDIPQPKGVTAEAAVAFANLAQELKDKGDPEALDYLGSGDPTLSAFLLDARKPGYYLYNADSSIVGRIMEATTVKAMGIRRVHKPDESLPHMSSVYLYRPQRVVERLNAVEDPKLNDYGRRLALLAPAAPKQGTEGWAFVEYLSDELKSYPASKTLGRWELPAQRGRNKPAALDDERWSAFQELGLDKQVWLVSEPYQTRGKLAKDGKLQLAALEELGRRKGKARAEYAAFLKSLLD